MDVSIWSEGAPEGVRGLRFECASWALSPDDRWLAWSDVYADEAAQTAVYCAEVETGRVVFEKRGGPVKSIAFTGPEQLLVVREQTKLMARAVLHAVPDGGVIATAQMPSLPGLRCRVECAATGSRVLVAPVRWHGLSRERSPSRRLAYVLAADTLDVLTAWDPDETDALPRLPEVRSAVATLAPDGDQLVAWLSSPAIREGAAPEMGTVISHDWSTGRDVRRVRAGRRVDAIRWLGPHTLALRSAEGDELAHRGDLDLVDLHHGEVIVSTDGAPDSDWMGGRSTLDLHPDRDRLLVTGRASTGAAGAKAWSGLVREVLPATGALSSSRAVSTQPAVALGAAWLPAHVGGLALLRARTTKEAELLRLPTFTAEPDARMAVALDGRKPSHGALQRSPGETLLVVTHRVEPTAPPGAKKRSTVSRIVDGPLWATRVTLIDATALR